MKKHLIAAAAASLISLAPAAQAQWVVIDPTNLAQNLMTAANTLEQINYQIKQLQNQAQSLMNEAKNLTNLDFSALNELRAALSATNQLIQQAQGLAFNVSQMETEFRRLYPESYTAATSMKQLSRLIGTTLVVLLVVACSKPAPIDSVESLVANPERLKELRARCKADHASVGDAQCNAVAEATRQRFLGNGGPKYTPPASPPVAFSPPSSSSSSVPAASVPGAKD